MLSFPAKFPALKVEQPMGVYYVTVLPAELLLEVAFSDVLSADFDPERMSYRLRGTQRLLQPKRLQQIADYINRSDAAFPNSIILAANYREEDGCIEDQDHHLERPDPRTSNRRWTVEEASDGTMTLCIPTKSKLAAIIDGQHRLFAFTKAESNRLSMNLICSIFIDLPKPFQAQLFATINSTQKQVDRSLTFELFGYNLEEEAEELWTPDKLAVFMARKLGADSNSPLLGRIAIAPRKDELLSVLGETADWKISTSVVVDGILGLITTNPKKDTALLLQGERRKRSALRDVRSDRSPLRELYIDCQDQVIYTMTLNYLRACEAVFWKSSTADSYIRKTVGIQALFDILKKLARSAFHDKDISYDRFVAKLVRAGELDFATSEFRNASGSGRTHIRQAIERYLE